jgi:DNA-directed RNA polymerase subunit M/transcription elongation factor TFIIS
MCGGSDLVKQDGVFVCQNCGTKYSVEEAKNMMVEGAVTVEGTVAVEGTVKVDKSEELKKLYTLARRAKESDNTENAVRYYTQIEMQDPDSWEAYFYLIYFKARVSKIGEIHKDCKNLSNCFSNTFDLLASSTHDDEKKIAALRMIITDIKLIGDIMGSSAKEISGLESLDYEASVLSMIECLGDSILKAFPELPEIAAEAWKTEIDIFISTMCWGEFSKDHYKFFTKGAYTGYVIDNVAKKIYDIDPTYEDPFGVAKKLRKNERFINCPKCGATMRERESKCPQCGTPKEEIQRLIAEKEAAEAAERERIRKEREAKEAEEARIRAEKRAEWWAANKKKVGILALVVLAIIGVIVTCIIVANNGKSDNAQLIEEVDDSQIVKHTDNSTEKIQDILSTLSANCSKSGNTAILSDLFTETIDPYVKEGTTKKAKDISESMRKFLSRYDYYEMSSPSELNVQPQGSGYIATYNVIVEWNSKRTGHKHACLQKTVYLNSEYKITGFTDNELWRENVENDVETKTETTDNFAWIYGTWYCDTPYGRIELILKKDGRMYDGINEKWYNYKIQGGRIIEQCEGYVSTYNIDEENKRFDAGEPGEWFYKVSE